MEETILTYLRRNGELDFCQSPFNEVDNLVFAELAYTKMDDIVPGMDSTDSVSICELCRAYETAGYKAQGNSNDAYPLLRAAADSRRFSEVRARAFVNETDREKQIQFSAVTFLFGSDSAYVAYRGTDNSIVGWREDFMLSYLSETPGQAEAVHYLNRTAAENDRPLYVGGHSKGGNLAVFAAAFCDEQVKPRILAVFSNDGPGFNSSVTETPQYRDILRKVRLIIPESSIIGILLSNKEERSVIDSSAFGFRQHDPYTWQVEGNHLRRSEQTAASQIVAETLHRWTDELDGKQRETLVRAIFDSMDAAGVSTLTQLNENPWNSYSLILRAAAELDPEIQRDVLRTAQKLAASGRDVLWEEVQNGLHDMITQIREKLKTQDPGNE